MKIGATTIPLAGWVADPRRPQQSRAHRLAAIRQLVTDYDLSVVELTSPRCSPLISTPLWLVYSKSQALLARRICRFSGLTLPA